MQAKEGNMRGETCRTRRRERGKIGKIGEERLKRGEVKGGRRGGKIQDR